MEKKKVTEPILNCKHNIPLIGVRILLVTCKFEFPVVYRKGRMDHHIPDTTVDCDGSTASVRVTLVCISVTPWFMAVDIGLFRQYQSETGRTLASELRRLTFPHIQAHPIQTGRLSHTHTHTRTNRMDNKCCTYWWNPKKAYSKLTSHTELS